MLGDTTPNNNFAKNGAPLAAKNESARKEIVASEAAPGVAATPTVAPPATMSKPAFNKPGKGKKKWDFPQVPTETTEQPPVAAVTVTETSKVNPHPVTVEKPAKASDLTEMKQPEHPAPAATNNKPPIAQNSSGQPVPAETKKIYNFNNNQLQPSSKATIPVPENESATEVKKTYNSNNYQISAAPAAANPLPVSANVEPKVVAASVTETKKTYNFHQQVAVAAPLEIKAPEAKKTEEKKITEIDPTDPFAKFENYDPLEKYRNAKKGVPTGPIAVVAPAGSAAPKKPTEIEEIPDAIPAATVKQNKPQAVVSNAKKAPDWLNDDDFIGTNNVNNNNVKSKNDASQPFQPTKVSADLLDVLGPSEPKKVVPTVQPQPVKKDEEKKVPKKTALADLEELEFD